MTTTLIVRDATLAINGASEKRGEPREHLRSRVSEVERMEKRTAEECVEVLSSVAGGEGAHPEVLEALMIVALGQPPLAERLGLNPVATGRRLASKLERAGDIDHTLAVLELLQQHFPGQDALERDLAQLMRRQGMVQDLVNRYFERAKRLVREGRHSEAAGWLREVLQLDPSRKDAQRMIRDLRFKSSPRGQKRGGGVAFVLSVLLASSGLSYAVLREYQLRGEFRALPQAAPGNMAAQRRRLADIEEFSREHPIWLGALGVLAERSELRVQLAVYDDKLRLEHEAAEQKEKERLESAELCRLKGMGKVEEGDIAGALKAFREALGYGGPGWGHFEEVTRDVSELEEHMGDKR